MVKERRTLTPKEVDKRLKSLSAWEINKKGDQLSKSFTFASFIAGLAFIAKIAVHAEILNHHPDIELSYDGVKVKLRTHDAGGLTSLDFDLAKRIDGVQS